MQDKHFGMNAQSDWILYSLVHIPETCNSEDIIIDSLQVGSTRVSGGILIPSVLENAVLKWDELRFLQMIAKSPFPMMPMQPNTCRI